MNDEENLMKEVNMLKDSLNQLTAGVKAIIGKVVDVVHALLDGIIAKTRTVRGTVLIIVIALLLWDVIQKGGMGVIAYSIEQIKLILNAIADIIKAGGWQLVIVALILVMLKKDR
jgi:hypothetical protein